MKLRALAKIIISLALTAVAAGAWDFHVLGASHEAGENCQFCAVASAPELNADCGSALLARPDNFVLVQAALPGLPAGASAPAAFRGRAPPRP
ncbi:MAG: hypothetical protein A2X31_10165 [Elusimicrobia bacterium GWB2_63_22]|nr:MAG: hypothetical protein A2X31_10165 [Elusimicrobia bacterium GWB2_63_22]